MATQEERELAAKRESGKESLIVGVIAGVAQTANVVDRLLDAGLQPQALGLLASDRTAERHLGPQAARNQRGALDVYGANLTRLAEDLSAIAALGTPGSGLVARGPLATALVSAGLGSSTGLGEALAALGVAPETAREVADRVKNGALLVSAPRTLTSGAGAQPGLPSLPLIQLDALAMIELSVVHSVSTGALVTRPSAPAGEQRARYEPVADAEDVAVSSRTGEVGA